MPISNSSSSRVDIPGPQGPQGLPGIPGYTPVKGVDYFDGVDGKDGAEGVQGPAGYTPVKGVDYFDGQDGKDGAKGDTGEPGISAVAPTYAVLANGATAMNFGANDCVKVTPTANATYTTTVPPAGSPPRQLLILTSGTTSRTITFGAGFKPRGTLATGTVTGRVFVILWVSDGVNLYEAVRSTATVA